MDAGIAERDGGGAVAAEENNGNENRSIYLCAVYTMFRKAHLWLESMVECVFEFQIWS